MVTVEEKAGLVDAKVVEEWSGDVAPISLDPLLEAILLARDYEASHVTRGGQGKIRRLRNTVREVDCAVKTALESEVGDAEFRRLQREAAILRRLTLPGVVEYVGYEVKDVIDEFGIPDRKIDLYTKWVNGDTLEKVRDAHDITPEKIRNYRDQFLDTLGQLHQRGILHRDIKPMNVVKTLDEKLVLLDLGLAKREGDLSLTGSKGTFIGTYNYTAQELREGKKATVASDLYAVGVTLVELLRGKEFAGVVDAADVRFDLAEYGRRLDTDVRESLEAMLVDDPVQRMEKFRLVEGKYVYGKEEGRDSITLETVADDSLKAKWKNWRNGRKEPIKESIKESTIDKTLHTFEEQGIPVGEIVNGRLKEASVTESIDDVVNVDKEKCNTTSITESPNVKKRSFKRTDMFFSSLIGGGYGVAGGSIIGGIYDIYKGQFGAPEINPTDETSLMITLIGATSGIIIGGSWNYIREKYGSIRGGVKNIYHRFKKRDSLEERVEPTDEMRKEYHQKVANGRAFIPANWSVAGTAVGGVGSVLVDHLTQLEYPVPRALLSMALGYFVGIVGGKLYHEHIQVPRLQQKYGIEETVEEPELKYYPAEQSPSFGEKISRKMKIILRSKKKSNELIKEMEEKDSFVARKDYLINLATQYQLPEGKETEYLVALKVIATTENEHTSVKSIAEDLLKSYEVANNFSQAETYLKAVYAKFSLGIPTPLNNPTWIRD